MAEDLTLNLKGRTIIKMAVRKPTPEEPLWRVTIGFLEAAGAARVVGEGKTPEEAYWGAVEKMDMASEEMFNSNPP